MGITENNSSHPIATSLFSREAFPPAPLKQGALACAVLLAMGPLSVSASDLKVTPHLDISATYTDNVSLAPRGGEKSDLVIKVSPGVSV